MAIKLVAPERSRSRDTAAATTGFRPPEKKIERSGISRTEAPDRPNGQKQLVVVSNKSLNRKGISAFAVVGLSQLPVSTPLSPSHSKHL